MIKLICINCRREFVLKAGSEAEREHFERSGACCPACIKEAESYFESHTCEDE